MILNISEQVCRVLHVTESIKDVTFAGKLWNLARQITLIVTAHRKGDHSSQKNHVIDTRAAKGISYEYFIIK